MPVCFGMNGTFASRERLSSLINVFDDTWFFKIESVDDLCTVDTPIPIVHYPLERIVNVGEMMHGQVSSRHPDLQPEILCIQMDGPVIKAYYFTYKLSEQAAVDEWKLRPREDKLLEIVEHAKTNQFFAILPYNQPSSPV